MKMGNFFAMVKTHTHKMNMNFSLQIYLTLFENEIETLTANELQSQITILASENELSVLQIKQMLKSRVGLL